MGRTVLPSARPRWPRALICAASRPRLLGSFIRKGTPRTLAPQSATSQRQTEGMRLRSRCNLDIHGEEATNDSEGLPGLCSIYDDTPTKGRRKVYLRFENLPGS